MFSFYCFSNSILSGIDFTIVIECVHFQLTIHLELDITKTLYSKGKKIGLKLISCTFFNVETEKLELDWIHSCIAAEKKPAITPP